MWDEICSTCMWDTAGFQIYPEDLPITRALRKRLEQWAEQYTALDGQTQGGDPWEVLPHMPVARYTAEGRELAVALQTELSPDWTIVAFDVDSWRFPQDDQEHRCLRLKGTATSIR